MPITDDVWNLCEGMAHWSSTWSDSVVRTTSERSHLPFHRHVDLTRTCLRMRTTAVGAMIARDAPPALQTVVSALLRTKLELAIAGLDGCGKTTLCNVLQLPQSHHLDSSATSASAVAALPPPAPTIGLVVQRARARGIELMLWDLGGHHRFRDDWKRHVRGCGVLLFVVDCNDASRFGESRQALQRLLEDPVVSGMPLLVLAYKVDLLPPATRACEEVSGWRSLAEQLGLAGPAASQSWSVLGVSATRATNIDKVVRWLVLQAHGAGRQPSADSEEHDVSRHSTISWHALSDAWTGAKRRLRGSGRYTSVMADASRSLILSED